MKYLKYRRYIGTIEFSVEDGIFCGRLLGIVDFVSYDGETIASLIADFKEAVDNYICKKGEYCKRSNSSMRCRDREKPWCT